jgi:phosphoenolpyruvate carboxykinase (diphosphate)
LNNALVAWLLAGHNGFVTAAGYVGPRFRVDHDISLLAPEVWCRMSLEERDPGFLIANNYLDKCQDFEHAGRKVLAHRLGYRINARFVAAFFGRVFNHPASVFTEEMLRPEKQDMEIFADGMDNIVSTQRRVAQMYFDDGSVTQACPPLRALLHIMVADQFEGKRLDSLEIRGLFRPETLLSSEWYQARLEERQDVERKLWTRHIRYLEKFLKRKTHEDEAQRLGISERLSRAIEALNEVESKTYVEKIRGSIGTQPMNQFGSTLK